jgi:hypothetical protein
MKRKAPVKKKQSVRFIRCKRCKWVVAINASKLEKGGTGWRRLHEHMMERHPKYLEEIRRWVKKP